MRTAKLVDCGTGEEFELHPYDGKGRYQIDVVMQPGRVVWLVLE